MHLRSNARALAWWGAILGGFTSPFFPNGPMWLVAFGIVLYVVVVMWLLTRFAHVRAHVDENAI